MKSSSFCRKQRVNHLPDDKILLFSNLNTCTCNSNFCPEEKRQHEKENMPVISIFFPFQTLFSNAFPGNVCVAETINSLHDMPILGSSNTAANKDMMAKIWPDGETNICFSRKRYGKRRNCSLRAISPLSIMFSKAVCY